MLYLHALGHFHPDTVLDNEFLTSLDIGVDPKWIEDRVGILQRRTTLPLEYIRQTRNQNPKAAAEAADISATQMAVGAVQMALARAGLEASQLGMVISGGCSPEMLIPAEASRVACAMGLGIPCFDLQSACSSFASQIHFLNMMRPEALPDFVVVINSEAFTHTIDYNDRRQAVLFGDGAAAAIVSSRVPSPTVITDTSFASDPSGQASVVIPTGGHFGQEGRTVQAFAIKTTSDVVKELQEKVPADESRRQVFIGHQANLRMLENVCKRVGIEGENHYTNIANFGNTGAAGAPTVLSQRWDELQNSVILVAVVGSGLAWGGMRITRE